MEPGENPGQLALLYPATLSADIGTLRTLEAEAGQIEALIAGVMSAPGKLVHVRGVAYRKKELPAALTRVKGEIAELNARLQQHDLLCRSWHQNRASELGGQWQAYLDGLLALIHYAEHAAADVQDAHGLLNNTTAVVTAVQKVSEAGVVRIIETAIGGKDVTTLYEGERRYSVTVRFPAHVRQSVEAIGKTLLLTPGGAQVPLSSVASIALIDGPAQISRESGKRRVVVGANVEGRDLAGFVTEVQQRIDSDIQLPEGYYFKYGGQFENMERAMATLAIIVPLTIVAIFFLLFLLFNSVKLASLIILVLPFASIGGLIGLFVTGE